MDSTIKRLAVICARKGSKGVKNKNLRYLDNRPLINHTIQQAKDSKVFDWIAISSDSSAILALGKIANVDFLIERPIELASDLAPKIPSIRHCAAAVEMQTNKKLSTIVDLDVTAPLRNIEDIRGAVRLLERSSADNVVSGALARRSPYFNLVEQGKDGRVHLAKKPKVSITRRQDTPLCFDLNASIFCWKRASLFSENDFVIGDNTILFEMPAERSIDIDTELDFSFVEFLMHSNRESRDAE